MTLIREFPFVSKDEILDAYLPVQRDQSRETAFRKLRRENLISNGIALSIRGPNGQMRGRPHIYCALNRDAARLARHGHEEEARRFAAESDRLEINEVTRGVVLMLERFLSEAPTSSNRPTPSATIGSGKSFLFAEFFRQMLTHDASARSAIVAAVHDVDAVRARGSSLDHIQVKHFGKVTRVLDNLAELDIEDGRHVFLPVDELEELDLAQPGTPVVLLWERWGQGRVLIESEPAIDLASTDEATDGRGGDFDPFSYGESPVQGIAATKLRQLLTERGTLHVPRPLELVSRD